MDQRKTPPERAGKHVSEGAKDEIEGQSRRINRYSQARDLADKNLKYIHDNFDQYSAKDKAKLAKIYTKLDECGDDLLFHHYYKLGKVSLVYANSCDVHLLCPFCAIRRGAKHMHKYLTAFNIINATNSYRLSMLTLTVKNGDNLIERFEHLRSGLSVLQERLRYFRKTKWGKSEFTKVAGYVGSFEVTNKGRGWHPHCHILVLHTEEIDQSRLAAEWQAITGDSFILRCDPCRHPDDPAQDFAEVFKYAVKFSSMSSEHIVEAYLALSGRRLLFSGGCFRGVPEPDSTDDDILAFEDYHELLYHYFPGSGYSLVSYRSSGHTGPGVYVGQVEDSGGSEGGLVAPPAIAQAARSCPFDLGRFSGAARERMGLVVP